MTSRLVVVHAASKAVQDTRGPVVWLADAVRAQRSLKAPPTMIGPIADLLGLRTAVHDAVNPVISSFDPSITPVELARQTTYDRRIGPTSVQVVAAAETVSRNETVAAEVYPEQSAAPKGAPRHLPPLADVLPPAPIFRTGAASLLQPGQQRALVGELCGRMTPDGDIDTDALVEQLTRREPLDRLPRLPRRTTRRGLQLLVDFGERLRGFQRDRDEVWRLVTRLAGSDGLEVLRFAGTPIDSPGAGPGRMTTWRSYQAPASGRPVLILSDLGTGAPAGDRTAVTNRWLRVGEMLRSAGCPAIALVPAPATRVPPTLRASITVVTWDRTTTVRDAVRATRRAGGRKRLVNAR